MRIYPTFITSFSSNIKSKKYNEKKSKNYIKINNNIIKPIEDKLYKFINH